MSHNRNERGNERQPMRHATTNSNRIPGAPNGFEGMNFEEQRGSFKNSDLGGSREDESANRQADNRKRNDRQA